jgi:hypothetical protein
MLGRTGINAADPLQDLTTDSRLDMLGVNPELMDGSRVSVEGHDLVAGRRDWSLLPGLCAAAKDTPQCK